MLDPLDPELPLKIANARALCVRMLEPIIEEFGALSISYGYIAPATSHRLVKYQSSSKPSHHMWNLGAAADVCLHDWVNVLPDDDTAETSPIHLAHRIDALRLPYSRLITYSESPYLCLAVSAAEVKEGKPRNAFYENRYVGVKQPQYKSISTPAARARAFADLCENDLPNGWRGAGYPTYHGGGRRQMHHIRVGQKCMLSDFMFDLQSIANGNKNIPNMMMPQIWDAFCAAGDAYDALLQITGCKRMSIVAGFVSASSPYFDREKDWRKGYAYFTVVPPEQDDDSFVQLDAEYPEHGITVDYNEEMRGYDIQVKVR